MDKSFLFIFAIVVTIFLPLRSPAAVPTLASTDKKVEEVKSQDEIKRLYLKAGVGGGGSWGQAFFANSFGGGFSLSAGGFLTKRWSLGLFYKGAYSTNRDFGLIGGGYYAAGITGLEADFSLVKSTSNEVRLGAKVARVSVRGVNTILFIPVAASEFNALGFGTTLAFYHFFTPVVGLGLEASYMQTLEGPASADTVVGKANYTTPSIGIYDLTIALQLRAF